MNMFKNLFIKWYLKKNREIHKISVEDEIELFKFKKAEDVVRLLKSIMTAQTLLHWEAGSEKERDVVRGSALILKVILDAHSKAIEIQHEKEDDRKLKMWGAFRKSNRTK